VCLTIDTIDNRGKKKDFYYTINHVGTQKKNFH
jgi:hypothetical protein